MDTDEYGEIINSERTYKFIADKLYKEPVIIGWTDNMGTHYDILFTYMLYKQYGNGLYRGLRLGDLFVSIIGIGSFGFEIKKEDKHFRIYSGKVKFKLWYNSRKSNRFNKWYHTLFSKCVKYYQRGNLYEE